MIEGAAEGGKGGESLRYTRTCKRSPLSQAPLWVVFAFGVIRFLVFAFRLR